MKCPLCDSDKNHIIEVIRKDNLIQLYKKQLNINIKFLIKKDITYFCCDECELRYFDPQFPGDENFYNQLQKYDWYYLNEKFEYEYVAKYLNNDDRVLEIGSGKGAFKIQSGISDYIGLEFSTEAKRIAAENGIKIFNETIEEHSEGNKESYTKIISFQVLEHVTNTKEFIEKSLDCLKSNGLMIIAVPSEESFMKFIPNGILNLPPHHMTRWTDQPFNYIAKKYDLELVEIFHEKVQPIHSEYSAFSLATAFLYKLFSRRLYMLNTGFLDKILIKLAHILSKKIIGINESYGCNGHTVISVFRKK